MKKVNATLFELCLGIFLYGVVFELVLLFVDRRLSFSLGLWIGIVLAFAGSVHMWWSLNRSMGMTAKDAQNTMVLHNLIRYFVIAAVILSLIYTQFANPIFAFCGYMGMKVSAYINPFLHKVLMKLTGTEDASSSDAAYDADSVPEDDMEDDPDYEYYNEDLAELMEMFRMPKIKSYSDGSGLNAEGVSGAGGK